MGGCSPPPWDLVASPFRCQVSQQLKQNRAVGCSQGQILPAGPPAPWGPVPSLCPRAGTRPGVAPLMFIALVSIGVAVLGFISVFLILPFCKVYIITKFLVFYIYIYKYIYIQTVLFLPLYIWARRENKSF